MATTIDSIISGDGTNTVTFQLGASVTNGQTGNFVYGGTNTIEDLAGNALAADSTSVTNNTTAPGAWQGAGDRWTTDTSETFDIGAPYTVGRIYQVVESEAGVTFFIESGDSLGGADRNRLTYNPPTGLINMEMVDAAGGKIIQRSNAGFKFLNKTPIYVICAFDPPNGTVRLWLNGEEQTDIFTFSDSGFNSGNLRGQRPFIFPSGAAGLNTVDNVDNDWLATGVVDQSDVDGLMANRDPRDTLGGDVFYYVPYTGGVAEDVAGGATLTYEDFNGRGTFIPNLDPGAMPPTIQQADFDTVPSGTSNAGVVSNRQRTLCGYYDANKDATFYTFAQTGNFQAGLIRIESDGTYSIVNLPNTSDSDYHMVPAMAIIGTDMYIYQESPHNTDIHVFKSDDSTWTSFTLIVEKIPDYTLAYINAIEKNGNLYSHFRGQSAGNNLSSLIYLVSTNGGEGWQGTPGGLLNRTLDPDADRIYPFHIKNHYKDQDGWIHVQATARNETGSRHWKYMYFKTQDYTTVYDNEGNNATTVPAGGFTMNALPSWMVSEEVLPTENIGFAIGCINPTTGKYYVTSQITGSGDNAELLSYESGAWVSQTTPVTNVRDLFYYEGYVYIIGGNGSLVLTRTNDEGATWEALKGFDNSNLWSRMEVPQNVHEIPSNKPVWAIHYDADTGLSAKDIKFVDLEI